jgi:branched-chain amino acid transport system substrate-binding protein
MSVAAVPVANQRKMPLISPTTSTVELTDIKDHFFRTISACDINARNLATYARQELKVERLSIVMDLSNIAFTSPWEHCFKEQFKELGGEIASEVSYISLRQDFSFNDLAEQAILSEPDSILILANSTDAALFSQQITKLQVDDIRLLGSDWSFSGDLIRYGGKSVEGFTFTTSLNLEDSSPEFKTFKDHFVERFGLEPKFPSTLAYEATSVLIKALRNTSDFNNLNLTLETIGSVQALQGTITLNKFGDTSRPTYINQVKNGDFVFIKEEN